MRSSKATKKKVTDIDVTRLAANALKLVAAARARPDLLKVGIPGAPTLWHIAVEPLTPNEKLGDGTLVKAEMTQEVEKYLTNIGRVISCGPEALVGTTESGCELSHVTDKIRTREDLVGKYVVYMKHSGTRMKLRDYRQDILVLTISEILMVTDDPEAWVAYA